MFSIIVPFVATSNEFPIKLFRVKLLPLQLACTLAAQPLSWNRFCVTSTRVVPSICSPIVFLINRFPDILLSVISFSSGPGGAGPRGGGGAGAGGGAPGGDI